MLREEDIIREMELYGADTEELWKEKFEGAEGLELNDQAGETQDDEAGENQNQRPRGKRIGVIGISPKAGVGFVAEALGRELAWREKGFPHSFKETLGGREENAPIPIEIIDLGEREGDFSSLDFLIVVEDGRIDSSKEENHRNRMIAFLNRLGIPFQLVVNRGDLSRVAGTARGINAVRDIGIAGAVGTARAAGEVREMGAVRTAGAAEAVETARTAGSAGEESSVPLFFPVMDFRPVGKLFEILEEHCSEHQLR